MGKKRKEPRLKPHTEINVNNFVTSEVSETRHKKLQSQRNRIQRSTGLKITPVHQRTVHRAGGERTAGGAFATRATDRDCLQNARPTGDLTGNCTPRFRARGSPSGSSLGTQPRAHLPAAPGVGGWGRRGRSEYRWDGDLTGGSTRENAA